MAEPRDNQVPLGELWFAVLEGCREFLFQELELLVPCTVTIACCLHKLVWAEGQSEISEIIQAVLTRNLQQRDVPFVLCGYKAANQHSNRDSLLRSKKE